MKEKEEQIKEKDKVINFKISEIEIIRKKARIWKFYAKGRENEINIYLTMKKSILFRGKY